MSASPLPAELFDRPFLGSAAVHGGLLTPQQLRHPRFVRLFRDVYVSVDVRQDLALRACAAGLILPSCAVVSGCAAAWLHGADVLGPDDTLEVTVPREVPLDCRRELRVRHAMLPPGHTTHVLGDLRVTTPDRTAFDLARRDDTLQAVVVLDALLHLQLVATNDVLALAERWRWRGVRRVPAVVDLADWRAESPQESRLRVTLVRAGLPRPAVQYEVRDGRGRFVARVDLAYPEAKLALEYDGTHHAATRLADSKRENALAALGWQVLRFTAADLRDPRRLVMLVASVLARRTSLSSI